jgi:hypothetical protein
VSCPTAVLNVFGLASIARSTSCAASGTTLAPANVFERTLRPNSGGLARMRRISANASGVFGVPCA